MVLLKWHSYGGWIKIVQSPSPCPLPDGIVFISCIKDCLLDYKTMLYQEWTGIVAVMRVVFITSVFIWDTQNKQWHSWSLCSLSWDSACDSTGIPLKTKDLPMRTSAMTKHFLKQNFPLWGWMLLRVVRMTWCRSPHAQVE